MKAGTSGSSGYMRQFDGLRAIAVTAVLVHHFIGADQLPFVLKHIPYAYVGVRLFFVLSGFLITGILLRERLAVDRQIFTVKHALRQFYARRFLRIFPLYYFVIAITLAIGLEEASKHWLSLVTYTFNIELSLQGWYPYYFAQFWSLSVEEQYYIFWPWVILLAPRRFLVPIAVLLIAVAPIYRWVASCNEFNEVAIYVFTFSSLDALGVGSLLAIIQINQGGRLLLNGLFTWRYAVLMLSLIVLLQVLVLNGHVWLVYEIFFELVVAFFFAWVVWRASTGFGGIGGQILECKVLVYLGTISYGIYVYHVFSRQLVRLIFEMLEVHLLKKGPAEAFLATVLTILMASLSWHFLEAPINNFKRRFPYEPEKKIPSSGG